MTRTGSNVLIASTDREIGARMFQSKTVPSFVPTANRRARWPGTSAGLLTGSFADIGVSDGEDALDRPEKPSNGSSDVVCVANVELSMADARMWTFLRPLNE